MVRTMPRQDRPFGEVRRYEVYDKYTDNLIASDPSRLVAEGIAATEHSYRVRTVVTNHTVDIAD